MSSDWEKKAAAKPSVDADGTLRYSQWVRSGGMMYNRDCLDYDSPEQTYNQGLRQNIMASFIRLKR